MINSLLNAKNKQVEYFSGINGIKSLYKIVTKSWHAKDTLYIAAAPADSFKRLEKFFLETVHEKRVQDKVILKILINKDAESFGLVRKNMPHTLVRFLDVKTTAEYGVLNDLLFMVNYGGIPYAMLIRDKKVADTYKEFFNILWNHGRKVSIPPLVEDNEPIEKIISKYKKFNPVVITDPHNFPAIKKICPSICVYNNKFENVEKIKKAILEGGYGLLIGFGGCTALDMARMCSSKKMHCIIVPSILSTVCISIDKSVFNVEGKTKSFQTEVPKEIIFSLPIIRKTDHVELVKWAQSGFGDLFAKIGAAIDVVFRETAKTKDTITVEKIRRKIPETMEALDWVLNYFSGYSGKDLEHLAAFLHEASVSIILQDSFELSGGGEHELAYNIEKRFKREKNIWPTHGQIVSIGTLIELKILAELTRDSRLFDKITRVYKKLELPTNYKMLEKIGIKKEFIIQGIKDIKNSNTLLGCNANRALKLVDKIFDNK